MFRQIILRTVKRMSKRARIIFAAVMPCAAAAVFIFRDYIIGLERYFKGCSFYSATGYLCPGCGNTRSVNALLHGHILTSVRNNPLIPFLLLMLLFVYTENLFALFGRNIKLLPSNIRYWVIISCFFAAFYILRNFLPALGPV